VAEIRPFAAGRPEMRRLMMLIDGAHKSNREAGGEGMIGE
jgi:hypothetical protein